MRTKATSRADSKDRQDSRRALRSRPTPTWLSQQKDLDEVARRRTLMVLQVLSGEVPVTQAIVEAKVSRGTYYQLENKALQAMLRALAPGAELTGAPGAEGMVRRISELELEVKRLLKEKRRTERLLFLTRKLVAKGPVVSAKRGRPRKLPTLTPWGSMKSGARNSQPSSSTSPNSTPAPAEVPSTSNKDGASE
ncbi:MAG: hypothetical protein JNM17_17015 [Archangium sp.]|nr:hypothetical protein [Archangium sp.]